ncbi:MAG: hypothetical protein K0M67_16510 [Thiobacillus sp.]|nr:hypothetical protein [Thiobacillus sp.]
MSATPISVPVSVIWTVRSTGQSAEATPATPLQVSVAQVHIGLKGAQGLQGLQGLQGYKGDKGDKGDIGDVTPAAEAARNAAQTARDDALTHAGTAGVQAGVATAQTLVATTKAAEAAASLVVTETARDAAFVNADVYADVATGLAAVADGEQFQVVSADGMSIQRYRRDAGPVAVAVGVPYPSRAEVLRQVDSNRTGAEAPNVFSAKQLAFLVPPVIGSGTAVSSMSGGLRALKIDTNAAGSTDVHWRFPISVFGAAATLAASLVIQSSEAGSSGTVFVTQRDMALATLQTDTLATGLSAAISTPLVCELGGIVVAVGAAFVDLRVQLNNSAGAKLRTSYLRGMCLRAGANPVFIAPPDKVVASVTPREASRHYPNIWGDPQLRDAGSTVLWDNGSLAVVTKNGVRCLETPASAVATNRRELVEVTGFKSGKFSASVVIQEKIGAQSAAGLRVRVVACSSSDSNAVINNAWSSYPDADYLDGNAYTKLIPTTDITKPTTLVICEGFDIPAGATHIGFDVRIETTVQAYLSHICIREGSDASYRDEYLSADVESLKATAAGSVLYVSPSGSDSTGVGSMAAPFATIGKALDTNGGAGRVAVLPGTYGPQSLDPMKVKGSVKIFGARENMATGAYGYPLIRMANKLTGITKTAGRGKIYQATTTVPTLTAFQWAYQDGVADPRTLIADDDRSPQHRGRTHRLPSFAKLIKPVATVLADALAEMDAEALPMAFVDSGVLYFTVVGGGDGAAADIYLDAATGLVSAGARGAAGELTIEGLEVRYGGVNLSPFVRTHVDELVVAGARANCVDYNVLSYGTLEVCASGSQSEINGDGLNGHNGAIITSGADLYAHDCNDDGFSDHEGCTSRMKGGGLVEYNGGGGLTPAYGADHVAMGFVSRRNQQVLGKKFGAFGVVGTPDQASPAESGYDTNAVWINCTDIESRTSFAAGGSGRNATAIGCKSIRPSVRAFDIPKIVDCGYLASGTSTAKGAHTVVENTALVT